MSSPSPSTMQDPKELVRQGYNALSRRYDEAYRGQDKYGSWLTDLEDRLPDNATVLDLGCGSGLPVAHKLAASGHRIVGVDISDTQVARARQLVPTAEFIRADATTVHFEPASFDAVVSFYALIHIPLEEQPALLARVGSWLRPGGLFVATTGDNEWTGSNPDWLGGGVPMWWSHPDKATSRAWLEEAGLTVVREEPVPEGDDVVHTLFWAVKKGAGSSQDKLLNG